MIPCLFRKAEEREEDEGAINEWPGIRFDYGIFHCITLPFDGWVLRNVGKIVAEGGPTKLGQTVLEGIEQQKRGVRNCYKHLGTAQQHQANVAIPLQALVWRQNLRQLTLSLDEMIEYHSCQ
jgi:hypothetical protein